MQNLNNIASITSEQLDQLQSASRVLEQSGQKNTLLEKQVDSLKSSFQVDVLDVINSGENLNENTKYTILTICNAINQLAIENNCTSRQDEILSVLSDVVYAENHQVVYFHKFDPNRIFDPRYPVLRRNLAYGMVKDKHSDRYCMLQRENGLGVSSISGGIDGLEDPALAGQREAQEESGYDNLTFKQKLGNEFHMLFFHPNKKLNYYSVCHAFLYEVDANDTQSITDEEQEKHHTVWMTIDEIRQAPDLEPTIICLLDLIEGKTPQVDYADCYNQFNPHPDKSKWVK